MNKQENASSQYLAFASRCPTQWKAVHSFLILAHEFYQRQKNVAVYLGIHAAQKALEAEDANQHHSFLNDFLAYLEKEKDTHISPDEKGVAVLLDVAQRLTKAANVRKLKVQKSVSKKQEDVTTSLKMYHTAIQLLDATAQFGDRGEDVEDLYQSVLQEMVELRDEKLSQADSSQIEAKSDQSTENSTTLKNPVVNSPLSAVSGQKSSTPTAPQGACVTSTVTLPNYDSQREISASGWVPPAPHNVRPDKDTLDRILEAQKSCKAALSSITYSDVQGATAALEKALKILMQ